MKRALFRVLIGWLALLAVASAVRAAGVRINTSPSVPRGLYWLTSDTPARDGYVAVCPPPEPIFEQARARGYIGFGRCPDGYAELIKVLAATPGEHVRIDASGVRVAELTWPSSAPRPVDGAGRPLPPPATLDGTLRHSSVLVMSRDCALGFDSRYFGPVPRSAVVATAIPLFTW